MSKDGSIVKVDQIKTNEVKFPFASYQKKKEYSYPLLKVKNSKVDKFNKLYLKDDSSSLIINDVPKYDTTQNILDLIYDPNSKIN